jgi:hypothetical protein
VGRVARIGKNRNVCRVFVGKPEGDNLEETGVDGWIKTDRTVIGWEDEEWIDLAQHREILCAHGNESFGLNKMWGIS